MAYEAYDRFLAAVKKFPRWTNTRRRPIDSNGGKILRSIIEEIEKVEDAIIEYKKDFFLVNYIGREEDLLDYIYIAQVGDIEDLSTFTLQNPAFDVTAEEAEFIADKSLALCRDGYVFLYETNEDNRYEPARCRSVQFPSSAGENIRHFDQHTGRAIPHKRLHEPV